MFHSLSNTSPSLVLKTENASSLNHCTNQFAIVLGSSPYQSLYAYTARIKRLVPKARTSRESFNLYSTAANLVVLFFLLMVLYLCAAPSVLADTTHSDYEGELAVKTTATNTETAERGSILQTSTNNEDSTKLAQAIDRLATSLNNKPSFFNPENFLVMLGTLLATYIGYLFSMRSLRWQEKRDEDRLNDKKLTVTNMLKAEIGERWQKDVFPHFEECLSENQPLDIKHGITCTAAEAFIRTKFDPHDFVVNEQIVHLSDRYAHLDDGIVFECLNFHYRLHDVVDQFEILKDYCQDTLVESRKQYGSDTTRMINEINDKETLKALWSKVWESAQKADKTANDLLKKLAPS